ncbi:MAG: proton-conducting transporter membrane subunit [Bacillota bacterium]
MISSWRKIIKNKIWYYLLTLLYIISFSIVITTTNWFLFVLGWELVTLFTTIILFFDNKSAAWKYLIVQFIGGSFLIYTVLVAYTNGYSEITAINEIWLQNMFVVAMGVKSALFGLHFWLPMVYKEASPAFCAISSGWVAKLGFITYLKLITEGNQLLLYLGLLMVFYGGVRALRENNYKVVLAYSSISQLGFIALAIGSGNKYGYIGAIIHIIAHGLAKTTLFNGAGNLIREYGSVLIKDFTQCQKRQFFNSIATFLSLLSLVGVPLFAGYNSKHLIKYSLDHHPFFIIVLHIASIITVLYSLRILWLTTFKNSKIDISSIKEVKKCKSNYNLNIFEKLALAFPIFLLIIFSLFANEILSTSVNFDFLSGALFSFIYIFIGFRLYFANFMREN